MSALFGKTVRALAGFLLLAAVLALLALACEDGDGGPAATPTQPPQDTATPPTPQKTTISTDFFFNGGYAPLLLASERGYFADEGLDVEISQGNPGAANLQLLSEGRFDFLYGAIDDLPYAVAAGQNVNAVAVFTHGNWNSIVVTGDSPIQGIEDLGGTTVGVPVGGGAPYIMFPDILQSLGVDPSSVEIVEVDFEVLGPSLLSGQFDAINMWYTVTPSLKGEDPNLRYYSYEDAGFDFLGGYGVMTSDRVIQEKPHLVRAVVKALLRAWADSAGDAAATIDVAAAGEFAEAYLEKQAQVDFLQLALTTLETPETETNGLGYSTDDEWQSLLDVTETYGGLEKVMAPENYYSNEFLPSEPIQP